MASKSSKEKAILKRASKLEYPTDRLGPGSLCIQQTHTNGSRVIMVNHQLTHMVSIKNPEQPLVPTGYENKLASYSSMLDQTDGEYEIVAKFVKNAYNYVLIGYDRKRKIYHAWKRIEMEEHSEGYSTRYNNKYIDSLEVGDVVPEGTFIKKSANFDKNMNYCYGKNVNTVYFVSPKVYEDTILVMNGADSMFNTFKANTVEVNLADNDVLLNWYGGDDSYQGFPLVGEKTREGFVCIARRVDNSHAPYSLKKKKLRHIERGDRKYYASGRVVDIEILTNKDRDRMIDVGATRVINQLYDEQQEYYRELYKYMIDIVDHADDGGYTYTDEFTIICEEAHNYVDSSAFFADTSDNVYGNTKIIFHLLEEEKLIVGSKLVGRAGNKGVISQILPPEKSWHMEDGTPIHFAVAALGIISRLNPSQLNEHSCNELSATAVEAMKKTDSLKTKGDIVHKLLKLLNPDEAKAWKKWYKDLSEKEQEKCCKRIERDGITIVQDPIDNANIVDFERAYEQFPPKYQRIVFEDGRLSMRKMLCAKMFFMRLKQDPLDKYASRSRGPVNPLNTLPVKSNLKKKFLIPYSDVAVRFGEMELEVLLMMCPHPAAVSNFMMENSTSFEAKLKMAEHSYLDDPDEEMDPGDIVAVGKKNIELIAAHLNVLSTEIIIETEDAPDGEWFDC